MIYTPESKTELIELVKLTDIPLACIDTSLITDLSMLFIGCRRTDLKGIETWNVSNATNMSLLLYYHTIDVDISGWNIANVRNMDFMFYGASVNVDLSSWKLEGVSTKEMFTQCTIKDEYKPRGV